MALRDLDIHVAIATVDLFALVALTVIMGFEKEMNPLGDYQHNLQIILYKDMDGSHTRTTKRNGGLTVLFFCFAYNPAYHLAFRLPVKDRIVKIHL